ncbi:C4-dicarboxylate ABC transporter [Falsiroseomonas sp.]|uniref:SLAC1 family transporter n=1 Tax=Falsiroseomonas sp. TaxID=2870721 RepID=UPI00271A00D1|nr:C4-dicarboxylate ABC transporter [Falsiroseomonas sp.]MDO9501477.1 C4-dicarboxylate ABC transporter [Falsiroseomonas sp.]MDP3417104.1 C4-dicarboxylate ABC transporter [Falsiroseomonas sp.]
MSGSGKRGTAKPRTKAAAPKRAIPASAAPVDAPEYGPALAVPSQAAPQPAAAPVLAAVPVPAAPPGLAHLPLPLLVLPMGLGGLGLAWREAAELLGAPSVIGGALLLLTALVWLVVVVGQVLRTLRYPDAMLAELRHPVRVAFAAAPTIGLMILAGAVWPHAPGFGAGLWCVAVALHLVVAMLLLRRVLAGRGEAAMLAPPLLIPFVGNILAPVFGVRMGFLDASWMMFGVGTLLWLAVFPLLLYRLVAGPPLPFAMRPSVAIFVAPPAVGALALAALVGDTHGVALAFTGVALLVAAAVLSLAGELARVPFSLSWWGVTFPSAAFAIMLMGLGFHPVFGWLALALNTWLTGWVAWRTLRAARSGVFLRPEAH